MSKYNVYVNASIVAGIIAALALSPTLLMSNSAVASLESGSAGSKSERCRGENHTVNFCSGYFRGEGDCNNDNKYKGNDKHHTSAWRTGYQHGWEDAGCSKP